MPPPAFPRPPTAPRRAPAAAGPSSSGGAPSAAPSAGFSAMPIAVPSPAPAAAPAAGGRMVPEYAALPAPLPPHALPPYAAPHGSPPQRAIRRRRQTEGERQREQRKKADRRRDAMILQLRTERSSLKAEIEPTVAPAAGGHDSAHELSPASAAVHRVGVLAPTPAVALLALASARRKMVPVAAEEAVAVLYEHYLAALPEDLSYEERQSALAGFFHQLRKSHQRWAKAEISGVAPIAQPLRLER